MAGRPKAGSGDELAALLPGETVVPVKVRRGPESDQYDADEVRVTEMDIMQIAGVIRALAPIRDAIAASTSPWEIAAQHPTEVCAALGIAIRWDPKRVQMLGAKSWAEVLAAVFGANGDFFGQLLALLVSAGRVTAPKRGSGDGEPPSPTSGATPESSTLN